MIIKIIAKIAQKKLFQRNALKYSALTENIDVKTVYALLNDGPFEGKALLIKNKSNSTVTRMRGPQRDIWRPTEGSMGDPQRDIWEAHGGIYGRPTEG